jgi:hypothetical protein
LSVGARTEARRLLPQLLENDIEHRDNEDVEDGRRQHAAEDRRVHA